MSLISQTLSPIVAPGLRDALLFGGERADWERIFDTAAGFRHDDAVLRVLDSEARREEHRREQERRLIWCAPAPAAASVGRPHIFRALFQKDVGGVGGASDVWCDADFVAVDGGSGKLQSWVDYIDNAHLLTQGTSGNQCVLPTTDAAFGGAKVVVGLGSAWEYVSNRAAARFPFLHSGAGGESTSVEKLTSTSGNSYTLNTTASVAAGYLVIRAGGVPAVGVNNGVGSGMPSCTGGLALLNTACSISFSLVSGASGAVLRQNSTAISTVTPTSLSASTPSFALKISSIAAGYYRGNIRSFYAWQRVLNAAQSAVRFAFIQKDSGVAP